MAAPQKRAGSAASAAGPLYPVDIKDIKPEALEAEVRGYYANLLDQPPSAAEFFSVPGRDKVKLEALLMRFLPLYREESKHRLLVLIDPQDKNTVLAIYLYGSWWCIEDAVKTVDPSREGLMQVQAFAERIVLFVLNYVIFGMLERGLSQDVLFVPHSEKEYAKIFWKDGEAAAFYTIKAKGSLCDGHSSQSYMLPVLDTVFVRRKFRRRGLGMEMLHDFCQMFVAEDAVGISCPVSVDMYQVCQRFLETHPEEQPRLWEVEAPGDWGQRVNVWLKIQLEQSLLKKADTSCQMERFQEDEPEQSDEGRMNKRAGLVPDIRESPDEAKEPKDDQGQAFNLRPCSKELANQQNTQVHPCPGSKKRTSRGEPAEDAVPKQFRAMP
ncbi:protein FAM169B-like isoform X3 [Hemicordylus capensis]|uniref:protein FAM169B-like isoform X3 n=1 Tax=Hemicordylus capensis TaxID=884348 RepID=UPI002302E14F|nr:protein FAM169B-like isoform X3 [Hemicordylus capensis]